MDVPKRTVSPPLHFILPPADSLYSPLANIAAVRLKLLHHLSLGHSKLRRRQQRDTNHLTSAAMAPRSAVFTPCAITLSRSMAQQSASHGEDGL